jgi:hypothetical protein
MKPRAAQIGEMLLLILIATPVLGVLLGGVYSWPAILITKGREPWLSLLLAAGLSVTVSGLGLASQVPVLYLGLVWVAGLLLLLAARRVFGALDHDLERFGIVHALALIATVVVIFLTARHAAPRNA